MQHLRFVTTVLLINVIISKLIIISGSIKYYMLWLEGQRAVENGAVAVSQPEDKQEWGQRVGYVRDIDGMIVRMGSYVHPTKQD